MEEVRRQLERLFPGKWAWELKADEENAYLAKFPSKVELQRAVAFGGADIRGEGVPAGVWLRFKVWQEKDVGFLLPKVWIRVFGLRRELNEFLDLWAIGSMLGPPRPWIWRPLGRETLGVCRWLFLTRV
jgi:predicted DNA-binding transcriptional regulator AlpA